MIVGYFSRKILLSRVYATENTKCMGEISWSILAKPKYWLVNHNNIKAGDWSLGATGSVVNMGKSSITDPKLDPMTSLLGQCTIRCKQVSGFSGLVFVVRV